MTEHSGSHFIFVSSDVEFKGRIIGSIEATKVRLDKGYWAISKTARLQHSLRQGDRIVFYAGYSGQGRFIACAKLASPVMKVPESQRRHLEPDFDQVVFAASSGVLLEEVKHFSHYVSAKALLDRLSFTKVIRRWGVYFFGSIIHMTEEDYRLILKEAGVDVDRISSE